jgi:hypothetical protein
VVVELEVDEVDVEELVELDEEEDVVVVISVVVCVVVPVEVSVKVVDDVDEDSFIVGADKTLNRIPIFFSQMSSS